jgi:hypothetical protein
VIALVTVLFVVIVSLLITRVATVALTLTGMSRDAARFQARSALTGTGFTTSEAESVVDHPVRRRIVMGLMLAGGAGLITAIATLIISFTGTQGGEAFTRAAVLLAGLLAVFLLARSEVVNRLLERAIGRLLQRYTELDVRDYAALLHLGKGFGVVEFGVEPHAWVAGSGLGELDLRAEGVAVLAVIRPGGAFVGAPVRETPVRVGDTLLLYGERDHVSELAHRRAGPVGDAAHERAVGRRRERIEAERDPARA